MANGDIALTTPRTIPNVVLGELNIIIVSASPPSMMVTFFEVDEKGPAHAVRIANAAGAVTGFDLTAGVFTDNVPRALAGYLTTILGVLFIGNASTLNQRKSAVVNRLIADGVITVAGTVG